MAAFPIKQQLADFYRSLKLTSFFGTWHFGFSITIMNGLYVKWRICFVFTDGDAYDVEITDYH